MDGQNCSGFDKIVPAVYLLVCIHHVHMYAPVTSTCPINCLQNRDSRSPQPAVHNGYSGVKLDSSSCLSCGTSFSHGAECQGDRGQTSNRLCTTGITTPAGKRSTGNLRCSWNATEQNDALVSCDNSHADVKLVRSYISLRNWGGGDLGLLEIWAG